MEKRMKSLFSGKSILKKAILGGASFCIAILFSSCKDFLNAGQTKGQIEKAIEYANASTYPIYIKYSGSNGIVKAPAGNEIHKKVTDKFSLSFDPIGDYEFAYWKLLDDATGEELPNGEYLSIASVKDSETTCTFVKAPAANMKLCISPILAERPQILSYAPMLSTEMSFKDSAIQVVFDYPMDINSIYYTDEELAQIMGELGITDKNDSALLKTTIIQNETEQTKYYGYIKEGITYIKNISITASETGQSLTGFFKAPVFLTENKLVISVNDYNSLPDYGEIQVEIKKDFFYTLNEKPITMSGSKKWIYQISETRDIEGPVVNKVEIKCGNSVLSVRDPCAGNPLPASTLEQLTYTNFIDIPFSFNVRARDTGNGLASNFYVYYKKVYDKDYKSVSSSVNSFSVPFESMTSYDASFNGDYATYLPDGVYELTFCFEDSLGNKTYYPDDKWKAGGSTSWTKAYAISVDRTSPNSDIKVTYATGNVIYINLDKDKSSPDFVKYNFMYRPVNEDVYKKGGPYTPKNGEDFWTISRDDEQDVDFYIQLIDYAGNTKDKTHYKIPSKKKIGSNGKFVVYGNTGLIASSYEVTQKEYGQYMTYYGVQHSDTDSLLAPSYTYGKGDNYPAYYVNWYEAIMYCNLRSMAEGLTPVYYLRNDVTNYKIEDWANIPETKIASVGTGEDIRYYCDDKIDTPANHTFLTTLEGIKVNSNADGYRLPTETEWVYLAHRADLNKNSDDSLMAYAGTNDESALKNYAWYSSNGENSTHIVGRKYPNGNSFLYDMCGNVAEWTSTKSSSKYVVKGGAFNTTDEYCKIDSSTMYSDAYIVKRSPLSRENSTGFRVVRTYKPE